MNDKEVNQNSNKIISGNFGIYKRLKIHERLRIGKTNASIGIRKRFRIHKRCFIFCLVFDSIFLFKQKQQMRFERQKLYFLSYYTFHGKYDCLTMLNSFMRSCFTESLFTISK